MCVTKASSTWMKMKCCDRKIFRYYIETTQPWPKIGPTITEFYNLVSSVVYFDLLLWQKGRFLCITRPIIWISMIAYILFFVCFVFEVEGLFLVNYLLWMGLLLQQLNVHMVVVGRGYISILVMIKQIIRIHNQYAFWITYVLIIQVYIIYI